MGTVIGILTGIFVLDCILLVVVILLQSGKGGGLASAFGGGGAADSAFGAKVSQPLRRATTVMASIFFVIALALALMTSKYHGSTVGGSQIAPKAPPATQEQPAGTDKTTPKQ